MTTTSGWDGILEPGETILWQGQPRRGVVWRDALGPLTFMGVLFTGFSMFWIAAAAAMTSDTPFPFSLFPLFGLPFLAIGLFMLIGHPVLDAYMRSVTWYTLTDRTAFIATDVMGRRTLGSYPIRQMPFLELVDGVPGTILFAENAKPGTQGAPPSSGDGKVGFRRIDGAREVYGQLRRLRRALRADGARGEEGVGE